MIIRPETFVPSPSDKTRSMLNTELKTGPMVSDINLGMGHTMINDDFIVGLVKVLNL